MHFYAFRRLSELTILITVKLRQAQFDKLSLTSSVRQAQFDKPSLAESVE